MISGCSKRLIFLGSLCLYCFSAWSDDIALIKVGDPWRFLPGSLSLSREAWHDLAYDDENWNLGSSGFIAGPYYTDATVMPNMIGNYSSAFFRKKFSLADPNAVKWLVLRVDYNDGFVAYLNGAEVVRRGLAGPAGTPPYFNAEAERHPFGATEEINLSEFIPLLRAGENILAMQAHNAGLFDSDFLLVPELLANFQRGPFIQNMSAHSVQIIYKTPVEADTRVEYGPTPALELAQGSSNAVMTHVTTLTNLEPDTVYYYRVTSAAGNLTAASGVESFRTFKTAGSLTFAVLGDSGSGSLGQYQIAQVLRDLSPDLVLHAGDIIYPGFVRGVTDTRCLSVYRPQMKNVPFFFTLGNHDLAPGPGAYLEAFYLPTNNVPIEVHEQAETSPEHYYSFDHGDAHFTVLFVPFLSQYELKIGDPQYRWFTNDLASSDRKWKFLLFHHPPRTSGPHGLDDNNFNGVRDQADVFNAVFPPAVKYGVQLIFTGHDHDFERFAPSNGVHSVVTGGGGIYLYSLAERQPGSAQFWGRQHCLKVTVRGDALELQAIDKTGNVFDSMSIQQAPPPRRIWQSAWHTPLQPKSDRSNDGDGNREGQVFDFIGEPIPALTGKSSNLGQVFVNNDSTNLYIGFHQTMVYASEDIFLFVESPRLPGVTNLVGIGNGVIDPDEQGADALDFLKNLSFTNFSPAVGCILGDEFADGQFRSFRRPAADFSGGQGIFYLNTRLTDFSGGRLQQFNRSPQVDGVPSESNADLIIVTLPFEPLRLQEGDFIRIGAVVGGAEVNTSSEAQSRELDSGYLGYTMTLSAKGKAVLQGVQVQLAREPDPDGDGLLTDQELLLGTDPHRPDTDGDGLMDGYEAAFGLNPLSADGADGGSADPDHDNLTNLEEQSAGTNPLRADSDSDGLPDRWEIRHGLSPLSSIGDQGGEGDPDHDGFSNLREWLAGTDPNNGADVLKVSLRLTGAVVRMDWKVVAGKKYVVEFADNPAGSYSNAAPSIFPQTGESNPLSYSERVLPAQKARFFRVRVVP